MGAKNDRRKAMRKIRVLEFPHQRDWGGTDKNSQLMMQHYDREKFEVFAASYVGGPRVQWIHDQGIPNFVSDNDAQMAAWIREQNIDVALFYRMGQYEPRDIRVLKQAGVPILIERNCFGMFDHSNDRHAINKHVVCSRVSVDIYKQRSGQGYDPNKVTYIYCPVDVPVFGQAKIDYTSHNFGRYSRKDTGKWHTVNITSLPLIREVVHDAKFYVIGLPDEYRELARKLGVLDMIVESEPTDDANLVNFINQISVFAHSSGCGESFGNTLAEAMAAGLPIVTHPGWDSAQTELVTDGFNGLVADVNDPRDYAAKVIKLLLDPSLKKQMGKNGRERAQAEGWFNVKSVVKQFEDIYIEEFKKLNP